MDTNSQASLGESQAALSESMAHPLLGKKQNDIQSLFNGIAPRYDLLNRLLSMNIDRWWREKAIDELAPREEGRYLDACAGTGDLAFALRKRFGGRRPRVYCSDFSVEMVRRGNRKGRGPRFLAGDTLQLPFADDTFDGAMVGFGIRNVENLHGGLQELRRVIRPGGRLILLEFTPMQNRLLRPVVDFYCRKIMPQIGNILSGSRVRAYSYLNASMETWPDGERLAERMREAGYKGVRWRPLFPGLVALHRGFR